MVLPATTTLVLCTRDFCSVLVLRQVSQDLEGATHLPAALPSFLGRDLPLAPRLITAVGQE